MAETCTERSGWPERVEALRGAIRSHMADLPAGDGTPGHPAAGASQSYFEHDPVKPGVEHYRLRDSGYPVCTIIGALRAADGDVHAVVRAYAVAEDQVHACIGLLLRYPLPILGRLAAGDTDEAENVPTARAEAG